MESGRSLCAGRLTGRKTVAALVGFLAVVLSCPGQAAAYSMVGPGGVSCGSWVQARRGSSPDYAQEGWVLGFLSGVGFMGAPRQDPLNGMDAAGVFVWLDNYCLANPLASLAAASAAFFQAHPH